MTRVPAQGLAHIRAFSMTNIKAIETRYKGYRFRSRLEARWAVFFDALGLSWEYEPEGFETDAGWYLPDFKVQHLGWFEVKPLGGVSKPHDIQRWRSFAFRVGRLHILEGVPDSKLYSAYGNWHGHHITEENWKDYCITEETWKDYCITEETWCFKTWTLDQKTPRVFTFAYDDDAFYDAPFHAINAARSARFEHGETP
jgi:hypothetical protein